MKKRSLLKMRFILFASIMLAAGFCLLFTASNSLAATYTVDISGPTVDVTYLADFTSQGFDPSTEEVISGSLYLMVRSSSSSSDTSFTITLENNERDMKWVTTWEALRITLEDFTLIDEDGTIEYIVTDYMGWGYTGAGSFTIVTDAISVPAPDITVDITNIPFGNITVNTSSDQTVTVTNDGDEDLNIGQINSISAPFSILNDNCSNLPIAPTVSCTFDVRFSPTAVTTYNNSLNIPSNDPDENPVPVTLSGTGDPVPVPDISADITNIPFGDVTVNTTSDQTVTITNDGNANLNIGQINSVLAPFSILNDTCSNTALAATLSCTFDVRFSPIDVITSNSSVNIPSDDPDENPVPVTLSGTGVAVAVPDIDVSTTLINFGSITEYTTQDQTVTITNNGNANLNIGQINSISAPFSILNDTCSNTALSASLSCTFDVRFSPTAVNTFNSNCDIPSDDPDTPTVTVSLSGEGLTSAVNQDPNPVNLVFPANEQIDLPTTVTFEWEPTTDPDGDPVTYELYNCTDSTFTSCPPTPVEPLLTNYTAEKIYYAGFGYGAGIMLFGILLAGAIFGRKKAALWGIIGIIVISSAILPSCGVFDTHQSNPPPTTVTAEDNNISHIVEGLTPGETYYWKVVAKDDTDGETHSDIWSYKTE